MSIGQDVLDCEKIIKNLEEHKPSLGVYLLCINTQAANLLEIYHSFEIFKPFIKLENIKIIGIYASKNEAKVYCAKLIYKYFKQFSDFDDFKIKALSFRWDN